MSNTDAKYTFFNIIKGQAKAHRKQTGIPLAQAQEHIAQQAGFSNFHELQTVAKYNPLDHRLMVAATGVSDLSEVIEIDEIYSDFQWGLEDRLASETAMTNATAYGIDGYEVTDPVYDDRTGTLQLTVHCTYSGEQDPDQVYVGRSFEVELLLSLVLRDREWSFADHNRDGGMTVVSCVGEMQRDDWYQ